ncbi:MAG: lysylphosphatidylglycerol synthase domain-containing protein [Proteobacteria bacterium]|nr:lysylphosphatidylglycerol synthase domain-containing protein [Pseudomonadota bacterium]
MIRIVSYIGLLVGLFVLALLIVWQGFDDIVELLLNSGFSLLLLPIVWLPCLIAAVISWYLLFPVKRIPPFKELFLALWMGRAINTLLPVASIGGEIAKARLLILWGRGGIDASASVLVDKTVQALALVPWAIIGTALLVYLAIDDELARLIMLGTLILVLGIVGFILVQRAGMFSFFARIIGKFNSSEGWGNITNNAHDVDALVKEIYSNNSRFLASILWRTFGLILQTSEVWLACYLLGHAISLIEALMLKSLTSIITDIAFIIPNGYGVQEGGYLMLGVLVGLTPEFSLAISLATRIRELLIDLPGLLYWQHVEAKYLLNKPGRIDLIDSS